MANMHGLRRWTSARVEIEGLLLLIRIQDLLHVPASGKWTVESGFYHLLSETQAMNICLVSIKLGMKTNTNMNTNLENIVLMERVQLTCVKKRFLFVESGGVVVL